MERGGRDDGETKGERFFRSIPARLSIASRSTRSTELKRANWRRDCCRSTRRSPVFSVIRDAFALRNSFQWLTTCISCATLAYYLRPAPPIFAILKFNIYKVYIRKCTVFLISSFCKSDVIKIRGRNNLSTRRNRIVDSRLNTFQDDE